MKGFQLLVVWKRLRFHLLQIKGILFDLFDIIFNQKKYKTQVLIISKPVIIFVVYRYIPRIHKLAYAIRFSNSYDIVLLSANFLSKEQKRIFPSSFTVKSPLKTKWLVKKIKPEIIHMVSNWNFDLAYYLIKNKNKFSVKTVFDDYDVFAGMLQEKQINLYFPTQIKKEKYCLENADGLCCRSLETQYTKQVLNYKITKQRIFFPEYMWNKAEINTNKFQKTLVYIGNYNNGVLKLADALQKINWNIEIYSAYHVIDPKIKSVSNLIVHKPVKPDELILIIRQYPVAIQFPGCILDKNNSIYTKEKYRYAASGKIFDYLEARLSVLISDELFQLWILKRYGAAIVIDEKDSLNDIIRKLIIFESSFKMDKVNYNHLTLKVQAPRLLNFYRRLLSEC